MDASTSNNDEESFYAETAEEVKDRHSKHHHSSSRSKSKHSDKSKKHKTHSKDRDSSKDKHKSSKKSSSKDKSRKDKKKDKEHSPSKKNHGSSDSKKSPSKESLDKRLVNGTPVSDNSNTENDSVNLVNGMSTAVPGLALSSGVSDNTSSSSKMLDSHVSRSSNSGHKSDRKDKHKKKDKKEHSQKTSDHKSKKRKLEDSSAEFGAALMGVDSHSKKKKSKSHHKSKDEKSKGSSCSSKDSKEKSAPENGVNSSTPAASSSSHHQPSLPLLDPNYRPLPRIPLPELELNSLDDYLPYQPSAPDPLLMTQEQTLNQMFHSKGKRKLQIYSGKASGISEVPSLMQLCIRSLQENINALEYTGGVPYDILKPILERATPEQLFNLEHFNPYLLDDTNPLWEQHCKKRFKNCQPEEMETFRDLFIRLTEERSQKLKNVTQSLQNKFVTKPEPRRCTVLAYDGVVAKPPKSVARAQAKFGTGTIPVGAPVKTSRAAEIQNRKTAMNNVQRVERANANSNGRAAAKKTKAPLYAKTLQFYKKTFRR